MQETRLDGSQRFTDNASMQEMVKAIENPENKTITIHQEGSRMIYGASVYEVRKGKRKRMGLSWKGTTETIVEHSKKAKS